MKSPTVSSRSGSLDVTFLEVRTARYSGACPSPPCFAGRVRISHLPRLAVIRPLRANPNAIPRIKRRGWSDLTYWSDPSRFPRMHGRCRHGVDAGAAGGRHTGPRARDDRIGAKGGEALDAGRTFRNGRGIEVVARWRTRSQLPHGRRHELVDSCAGRPAWPAARETAAPDPAKLKLLLDRGVNVNAKEHDPDGMGLLHMAALTNHPDAAQALIAASMP